MDYVAETFKDNAAQGISYAVAFGSLMVVVMHFSLGWLTDAYGLQKAMNIVPVLLLMSLAVIKLHPILFLRPKS